MCCMLMPSIWKCPAQSRQIATSWFTRERRILHISSCLPSLNGSHALGWCAPISSICHPPWMRLHHCDNVVHRTEWIGECLNMRQFMLTSLTKDEDVTMRSSILAFPFVPGHVSPADIMPAMRTASAAMLFQEWFQTWHPPIHRHSPCSSVGRNSGHVGAKNVFPIPGMWSSRLPPQAPHASQQFPSSSFCFTFSTLGIGSWV